MSVEIFSREWWLSSGVRIAVIVAVSVLLLLLSRLAVRRMHRKLEAGKDQTIAADLRRIATLTQALSYLLRTAVWIVATLLILGEFDISLGPLVAGAGIAGVALGFGAQSLVKDFLSGFFILFEDQFGVEDVVDLSTPGGIVSGKVEAISLRTTSVRAFDGTLHTVPNGNIQTVGNKTRGWARAIVDIPVAPTVDVDRVREILEELSVELGEDEELQDSFFSGPDVLGVERVSGNELVFRVVAQVRPSRRPDLERRLRQWITQRLRRDGIEPPSPPRIVVSQTRDEPGHNAT